MGAGCRYPLSCREEECSRKLTGCEGVEKRIGVFLKGSGLMLALHAGWVPIVSGVRKAAVTIATCWPRMLVLDSSKRVFERGLDPPLESPILVLRVILIIE